MSGYWVTIIGTLGMPALGLWFGHSLLKQFGFRFSTIGKNWSAIIAILFLLLVGYLTHFVLSKFNTPNPPQVTHSGQLGNLVDQVAHDPESNLVITLAGDQTAQLKKLFFSNISAPSYVALIRKMCAASSCITCKVDERSTDATVTISKTGAMVVCGENNKSYCCS